MQNTYRVSTFNLVREESGNGGPRITSQTLGNTVDVVASSPEIAKMSVVFRTASEEGGEDPFSPANVEAFLKNHKVCADLISPSC